jgi:hypothetical protein
MHRSRLHERLLDCVESLAVPDCPTGTIGTAQQRHRFTEAILNSCKFQLASLAAVEGDSYTLTISSQRHSCTISAARIRSAGSDSHGCRNLAPTDK